MSHDTRGLTYRHNYRHEAEQSRQFYLKHGAKVSKVFLDEGGHRVPNPKRSDGRYFAIIVHHPKKGYNFAARGYKGTVRRPTAFITGERGPERVRITPMKRSKSHSRNSLGNLNLNSKFWGL